MVCLLGEHTNLGKFVTLLVNSLPCHKMELLTTFKEDKLNFQVVHRPIYQKAYFFNLKIHLTPELTWAPCVPYTFRRV